MTVKNEFLSVCFTGSSADLHQQYWGTFLQSFHPKNLICFPNIFFFLNFFYLCLLIFSTPLFLHPFVTLPLHLSFPLSPFLSEERCSGWHSLPRISHNDHNELMICSLSFPMPLLLSVSTMPFFHWGSLTMFTHSLLISVCTWLFLCMHAQKIVCLWVS